MRRLAAWAAAFALIAEGAAAAFAPVGGTAAPERSARPDWRAESFGLPSDEAPNLEGVEVAGKKKGGGGKRGGAKKKRSGGFKGGDAKNRARRDVNRDRDVNRSRKVDRDIDRDVDVYHHGDWDDDDDDNIGAAIVGGVVGLGVGAAIASSSEPSYSCPDENQDGICDDNVAN